MNEKLTHLAQKIRPALAEDERAGMRNEFVAFMEANPTKEQTTIPSPFMRYSAAYAFALMMFITTPILCATERSLPNDPLYILKVDVLEPAAVATLSVTKDIAVDAKNTLLTRRLSEAQALVSNDTFGANESSELGRRISAHVTELQEYVAQAESVGDLSEALETSSELESILEGHSDALTVLSNSDHNEADDQYVDAFVEALDTDSSDSEEASEALEDLLGVDASPEATEYLLGIAHDAELSLTRAKKDIGESDTLFVEVAEDLVEQAEDAYSAGESSRNAGAEDSAISEFRDAFQAAEHSRILLRLGEEFHLEDPL